MAQAAYAYAVALLLLANSVNTPAIALQVLDVIAGLYFVVVGCIAGWFAARD